MNEFLFAILTSLAFAVFVFLFDCMKFALTYFYIHLNTRNDESGGGINWKENKAVIVVRNQTPWYLNVRDVMIKSKESLQFRSCSYPERQNNFYFEPYYHLTGGFISLPPYTTDKWDCPSFEKQDEIIEGYALCEFNFWFFSFLKKVYFAKKKIKSLNTAHKNSHSPMPKVHQPGCQHYKNTTKNK